MELSDGLRWFLALAETEQVTAAADMLQVAQPTLSRRLARLERDLGAELFDRHGRRLVLNDRGRVLRDHARLALAELSIAEREIASLDSPDGGAVRLGFLHSFGTWLIPEVLRAYRDKRPKVLFTLYQDAAKALVDRVIDGRDDLAFVSPRPRTPLVDWAAVTHQRLALAVPAGHRLSRHAVVDLGAASDEPFIGMHQDYGMRRIFDEMCADAGIVPNVVFESSELATIGGLVSASLGVAVMPWQEQHAWPDGVVLVPLRGAGRDIGIVWASGRTLPPAAERFLKFTTDSRWQEPSETGRHDVTDV
ncbi:LysR family transcriptional regulator [Rhodococcus sp. ABRD24]|uniref:LysR family transcriptional regulator n=1 Tax=Rhodococcus sp. ABRD24 TaxID=2507582 RepID=UPI00103ED7FC|nr:LysR family transcriptional regulator [Rhodococcus sp. ABRD24]QBJ97297.1 LysR family transcriptional regulator [Rhodococcus sp. ABRD24]